MEIAGALRLEFLAPPDDYMPPLTPEEIQAVDLPVLLLEGEKSPRYFGIIADELERILPKSTRARVPGAGHAMYAANPARFNAVVRQFVESS